MVISVKMQHVHNVTRDPSGLAYTLIAYFLNGKYSSFFFSRSVFKDAYINKKKKAHCIRSLYTMNADVEHQSSKQKKHFQ